jgi:homoserine kinase
MPGADAKACGPQPVQTPRARGTPVRAKAERAGPLASAPRANSEKPMGSELEVIVPATTANLGPGFDCLGLALQMYNRVRVRPASQCRVEISGQGEQDLPRDESNLMLRAAALLATRAGRRLPPLAWQAHHDIPLARGLGSSAAAIVAGLLVADAVLELQLSRQELLQMAAEIEGHPDNVAAAFLGGLTICLPAAEPVEVIRVEPHPDLTVVLCIPDFRVSTEDARRVLPRQVSFADAVFNLARTAGMVAALQGGLWALLGECTRDRLHQPFRLPLMAGVETILAAAVEAGAWGAALSGSGPTVAAFCARGPGRASPEQVAAALQAAVERVGLAATVAVAAVDRAGARLRRL